MRLAVGNVAAPFLRRRAVLIGDDFGIWCPFGEALAEAGIMVADPAAARELPAAIALLSSLKRGQKRKLDTVLARAGGGLSALDGLVKPVDDRAKIMVVGGWNPVSRPDIELEHVTPQVMARWMDAEDFKRPPITVFKKFSSAIADPGADLALPLISLVQGVPTTGQFESDAALAIVIGRPALRVSIRAALRHVIGLSLMLDVWDSEIFLEESRVRRGMLSKNLRRLTPLGPWIQLLDGGMVADDLEVTFKVGGTLRQRFPIGDLAYRIAEVISFCSSVGLEPGDILAFGARIARGTGPGPLETPVAIGSGDVVEVASSAVGTLSARIVSAEG